jgi:hypothetical protein
VEARSALVHSATTSGNVDCEACLSVGCWRVKSTEELLKFICGKAVSWESLELVSSTMYSCVIIMSSQEQEGLAVDVVVKQKVRCESTTPIRTSSTWVQSSMYKVPCTVVWFKVG